MAFFRVISLIIYIKALLLVPDNVVVYCGKIKAYTRIHRDNTDSACLSLSKPLVHRNGKFE